MTIVTNSNPDVFRQAMTCFASGVTAVTTREVGVPSGLIATSVCSLSVDPATVLVCVNKTALCARCHPSHKSFRCEFAVGRANDCCETLQFVPRCGPL